MFTLNGETLEVSLPQGKTNEELLTLAAAELEGLKSSFYGLNLKITGRITTHLAMFLGHELAHITKSVSLFDPKENVYFKVISHS